MTIIDSRSIFLLCTTYALLTKLVLSSEGNSLEQGNIYLKGHCYGILASFYNAEICSCITGNPKIMMLFCYLGLNHYTKTIYFCLSLSMARPNGNGLKFEKTGQFFFFPNSRAIF